MTPERGAGKGVNPDNLVAFEPSIGRSRAASITRCRRPTCGTPNPFCPAKGKSKMNVQQRRGGFTLIEVLIVVVIMAVLAATIIPQFTNSSKDARESSIKFNLHSLRGLIEMYKLHHQGGLPSGANSLEQLTKATNASGAVGTAGPTYPYGPYVQGALPTNPFTNGNKVTLHTGTGLPTASGATDAGWIYRPATGEIWIDHADYINE